VLSVNPKTEFVPSLFFSVPYFFTSASCLGQALAEAEGAGGGCLSVCLLGADWRFFPNFAEFGSKNSFSACARGAFWVVC